MAAAPLVGGCVLIVVLVHFADVWSGWGFASVVPQLLCAGLFRQVADWQVGGSDFPGGDKRSWWRTIIVSLLTLAAVFVFAVILLLIFPSLLPEEWPLRGNTDRNVSERDGYFLESLHALAFLSKRPERAGSCQAAGSGGPRSLSARSRTVPVVM